MATFGPFAPYGHPTNSVIGHCKGMKSSLLRFLRWSDKLLINLILFELEKCFQESAQPVVGGTKRILGYSPSGLFLAFLWEWTVYLISVYLRTGQVLKSKVLFLHKDYSLPKYYFYELSSDWTAVNRVNATEKRYRKGHRWSWTRLLDKIKKLEKLH